jgi:hypothetical protein
MTFSKPVMRSFVHVLKTLGPILETSEPLASNLPFAQEMMLKLAVSVVPTAVFTVLPKTQQAIALFFVKPPLTVLASMCTFCILCSTLFAIVSSMNIKMSQYVDNDFFAKNKHSLLPELVKFSRIELESVVSSLKQIVEHQSKTLDAGMDKFEKIVWLLGFGLVALGFALESKQSIPTNHIITLLMMLLLGVYIFLSIYVTYIHLQLINMRLKLYRHFQYQILLQDYLLTLKKTELSLLEQGISGIG